MSSRKYIKRVWRVPKTRGASEYLGALAVKLLRKHAWPAKFETATTHAGIYVLHYETGHEADEDFWDAVDTALRIIARTYRIEITCERGDVRFLAHYTVTVPGGHFRKSP